MKFHCSHYLARFFSKRSYLRKKKKLYLELLLKDKHCIYRLEQNDGVGTESHRAVNPTEEKLIQWTGLRLNH